MTKIILGKHTAVFAARADQETIRRFYCDVLGCTQNVEGEQVDRFQLDDVHFIFVYQQTAMAEEDFLKAIYLELMTDDLEETKRKILAFGVKTVEFPDPHLYFHAPGGQVFKLAALSEDLSLYETSKSATPAASAAGAAA